MSALGTVLTTPLTIVQAAACSSSGLNARALGAAMWSCTARFELMSAQHFGVADVLRVAMCPLFDRGTPWLERLTCMLRSVLDDLPHAPERAAAAMHLVGPKSALGSAWAPFNISSTPLQQHAGPQSFIAALGQAAAQLQTLATNSHITVAAVDSLMHEQMLRPLHEAGALSTEQNACGIIAGEGAAVITVRAHTPRDNMRCQDVLGVIHGACVVPFGASPAQALTAAIQSAVGPASSTPAVHTILWDMGADNHLTSVAETISALSPLLQHAQLVRPLQYIGCTGDAFVAVSTILALQGCRAGLTPGAKTLICTLRDNTASALYVEAPWQPPIMLVDAHKGPS